MVMHCDMNLEVATPLTHMSLHTMQPGVTLHFSISHPTLPTSYSTAYQAFKLNTMWTKMVSKVYNSHQQKLPAQNSTLYVNESTQPQLTLACNVTILLVISLCIGTTNRHKSVVLYGVAKLVSTVYTHI